MMTPLLGDYRRQTGYLAVLSALVVFSGCASSQSAQQRDIEKPGVPLSVLVNTALGGDPAVDHPAVLERLGEPNQVTSRPQQNRHDPSQIDTLRTLYYDGLRVHTYDVSGSENVIITGIEVTDAAYLTEQDLRVGDARSAVEATIGQPDNVEDGVYAYSLSDISPNWLYVHFEDEVVSKLEWSFYYD